MTAARTGKVDAVKVLLAHGANVNAKESWKQQTALMWAAHEGNAAAVEAAHRGGRQASTTDRSSAGRRCCSRRARATSTRSRRSSPAGANVNDTLPDGTSALVTADSGPQLRSRGVLLEHGVDPNAAGQGWTALHQIVWSRRPQRGQNNPGQKPKGNLSSLDLAKKLVEHGADINARETKEPNSDMEGRNSLNRYGATPFFLAAKSCDVPMMQALLALGADPFLATSTATSPLMVAAGVGISRRARARASPRSRPKP